MAENKKVVLVTGGNGGIGYELCKQLAAKPEYYVLLTARSVEKGKVALKDIQSQTPGASIELVELDVTKDDTIQAAVKHVESKFGRLDILVNNAAGISKSKPLRKQLQECFDNMAIGPAVLVDEFAPLLKKSKAAPSPRIVNVSTGLGSLTLRNEENAYSWVMSPEYRGPKAALNMLSSVQSVQYRGDGIKVFLYCPGFTESNLGEHNKKENGAQPTEEAVYPLIEIIEGARDAEAGKFMNHTRGEHPW